MFPPAATIASELAPPARPSPLPPSPPQTRPRATSGALTAGTARHGTAPRCAASRRSPRPLPFACAAPPLPDRRADEGRGYITPGEVAPPRLFRATRDVSARLPAGPARGGPLAAGRALGSRGGAQRAARPLTVAPRARPR